MRFQFLWAPIFHDHFLERNQKVLSLPQKALIDPIPFSALCALSIFYSFFLLPRRNNNQLGLRLSLLNANIPVVHNNCHRLIILFPDLTFNHGKPPVGV